MQYFPIFLDTTELQCLVVGAGEVAARKIELLLKTSAQITVVAPWVCDTVQKLAHEGKLDLHVRSYKIEDLSNKRVVFVATDDTDLNAEIHDHARAQKVLVNVVDNTSDNTSPETNFRFN